MRNVVDFGAFVDTMGLEHDGLVPPIADGWQRVPNDPHSLLAVGDIVTVWVHAVDKQRDRIQLTMLPPKKGDND